MIYLNRSAASRTNPETGEKEYFDLFKIGWTSDTPRKRKDMTRFSEYLLHNPTIENVKEIPEGTIQHENLLLFKFRRYKFNETSDEWFYAVPEIEKFFKSATIETLNSLPSNYITTCPEIDELDDKYPGCVSKLKQGYCVEEVKKDFNMSTTDARTLWLLFNITFVDSPSHLEEIKQNMEKKYYNEILLLRRGLCNWEVRKSSKINVPELVMLRVLFNLKNVDNTEHKKDLYRKKFPEIIEMMKKGWSNQEIGYRKGMINETLKDLRNLFKEEINPSEEDLKDIQKIIYEERYPKVIDMLKDINGIPNAYDITISTGVPISQVSKINKFFNIRDSKVWKATKPGNFPPEGSKEYYELLYSREIKWLQEGYSQVEITKMSPSHVHHKTLDKIQEIFNIPEKTIFDLFDTLGVKISNEIYKEFQEGDYLSKSEVKKKFENAMRRVDPNINRQGYINYLKYFFDLEEVLSDERDHTKHKIVKVKFIKRLK